MVCFPSSRNGACMIAPFLILWVVLVGVSSAAGVGETTPVVARVFAVDEVDIAKQRPRDIYNLSQTVRFSSFLFSESARRQFDLVDAGGLSLRFADQVQYVSYSGGGPHSFVATIFGAFNEHRPLRLKPQHFWLLVTQAVARHVNKKNAEAGASQPIC